MSLAAPVPVRSLEVRCPQCGARLMGSDMTGDLVIKGTRVLRLRGERFQAKCAACKTWTILPLGVHPAPE